MDTDNMDDMNDMDNNNYKEDDTIEGGESTSTTTTTTTTNTNTTNNTLDQTTPASHFSGARFDQTLPACNCPPSRPSRISPPTPSVAPLNTEVDDIPARSQVKTTVVMGDFHDSSPSDEEENGSLVVFPAYASSRRSADDADEASGLGLEEPFEFPSKPFESVPIQEDIGQKDLWMEGFDQVSQRIYYYNSVTRESAWERPTSDVQSSRAEKSAVAL
uniref:WW domain-containing protein n=1 Tax=Octactis speculum TaxID=3111310 RepID=A0A7S2FV82_9STRA